LFSSIDFSELAFSQIDSILNDWVKYPNALLVMEFQVIYLNNNRKLPQVGRK
jgi:hypothetical protein